MAAGERKERNNDLQNKFCPPEAHNLEHLQRDTDL